MQIGSSSDLAKQLQALQNAANGEPQDGSAFSLLMQTGGSGTSPAISSGSDSGSSSSSSSGWQLSGSSTTDSLIAVGTMGSDGKMTPFSQQQIQSEEQAVAKAGKNAYSDALQNFMTLSQASGQLSGGTYTDQQSYVASNGLVSANFDTSLTLKPVGGGIPSVSM